MTFAKHSRPALIVGLATAVAAVVALSRPAPSAALPDYSSKTGQACATCHVNSAGGGELTAKGKAFQAISIHVTDPLAAWNQVSATPVAAAAPAPAATGAVSVSVSGALVDDSAVYSIVVSNPTDNAISNVYVAGSIPAGATFKTAASTPAGAGFLNAEGGVAAWLVNSVAAKGKAGPFVYSVSKGSARDLAVSSYAHWLAPAEGSAVSTSIAPISDAERLAIDQAINNRFSTYNAEMPLWRTQPGTAPRMVELTEHFNLMWYAAQSGNWTFADFEVYRSDETLKGVEVTRPARTAALRAWWQPAQAELEEAIKAKDLGAFTKAYDRAVDGCNSCHIASSGGGISLKGVKVTRPATPLLPNLDYAGN